jgi:DNA-binding PucR family transcriptional regulator
MPPTLAAVAALPQLGLITRARIAPETAVRWVAVSELEDPTPFLEGGELVLTTGMRLADPAVRSGEYVARLAGRGVAGLGFGVGLSHETVPDALVEAAAEHGLPLLEVPRPTPFIAIGKAVSRMLATERYEDLTRAFQAQRELTRAALGGPGDLVARLARELDGWTLLLDGSGAVRHAAPEHARSRAGELLPELGRLRGSAALSGRGDHIVLQPLALGGRRRGFLVVGTADRLPPVAHTIVATAVSLLTLQTEEPRARRELRAALAGLLLGYRPAQGLPEPPVRVLACAGGDEVLDALEGDAAGECCLALRRPAFCVVITPDRLTDRVIELARACGPVGVGEASGLDRLERGLRQAEQALSAALRARDMGEHPVLRHADLPGQGILGLLDPQAAQGFAAALLAPLRAHEPVLVDSLRAYLEANGQGEAAARMLGVHRHTLRHRMRRVAELLDRDIDDPAVRAELWIALNVPAPTH